MDNILDKLPAKSIIRAFEASHDGLHILDKDGNTLYINEACMRIEGTSIEEVYSKNIRELVEDGVYSQSVTLMVVEKREPVTIRQTTSNGKKVLTTGTPVFDENGEVEFVICNSRDVTSLSQLQQELSLKEIQLEELKLEQNLYNDVVAFSTEMQKILGTALHISKVDSNVLITGESGVGKGVLAKFIHNNGNRAKGPFIKVDCSSIPETLFESELFGYVKGAFTGANQDGKTGLLEMADGGTVFLDEIGEMPISMQPKLMRTIQDLEILPVGSEIPKRIDVRFISATNIDLTEAVNKKQFREDLYYRLNVIPIGIPPLRNRRDDIPPLINQKVSVINRKYNFNKRLSSEAFDLLVKYDWPGNVRQLQNVIERILVSNSSDVVEVSDLPIEITNIANSDDIIDIYGKTYKELLADYDMKVIATAVEAEGSIPKAAALLGVDATTLRRKITKYKK